MIFFLLFLNDMSVKLSAGDEKYWIFFELGRFLDIRFIFLYI